MRISKTYGTHLPVLIKLLGITDGPILELGIGLYSTTYLHWTCFSKKRKIVSYENQAGWIYYFEKYRSDFHQINFIENWDELEVKDFWDIILIDHGPDIRRGIDAGRFANNAKYIILHDSEPKNDYRYRYSEIYPLFKYRFDFNEVIPHTTVLSNFVDLTNFKI